MLGLAPSSGLSQTVVYIHAPFCKLLCKEGGWLGQCRAIMPPSGTGEGGITWPFRGTASRLLPPRKQLLGPWQRWHQSGLGEEDTVHQFPLRPDTEESQDQVCLIFLIESCISLAAEASSVPEAWEGGEVCGML